MLEEIKGSVTFNPAAVMFSLAGYLYPKILAFSLTRYHHWRDHFSKMKLTHKYMTDRAIWLQRKTMTRAQFRASGGCNWLIQSNSPGNSLRIPNGTLFKIRLEGPESSIYVLGCCENGRFVVKEGDAIGQYPSASAAVNAVRRHVESTNAYLYIEFQVGNSWILADDLRYDPELSLPENFAEESAMRFIREKVRAIARRKKLNLTAEEIEIRAEKVFDENPRIRQTYEEIQV